MAAAAAHVVAETPGTPREWRQTLPLAVLVGAGLGALSRPLAARVGALAALGAVAAFVAAFAAGHALISGAALGSALAAAAGGALGAGGAAALGLGALAGWANGRFAPSRRGPEPPERP